MSLDQPRKCLVNSKLDSNRKWLLHLFYNQKLVDIFLQLLPQIHDITGEKVKTVDFSETIGACDLKVGRCRQLKELMKE